MSFARQLQQSIQGCIVYCLRLEFDSLQRIPKWFHQMKTVKPWWRPPPVVRGGQVWRSALVTENGSSCLGGFWYYHVFSRSNGKSWSETSCALASPVLYSSHCTSKHVASYCHRGIILAAAFLGAYLVFISLWFPLRLLSFAVSEWGVYALATALIFVVACLIIRLNAFPGSLQQVSSESENGLSKYSVWMIHSAWNSLIDVAAAISSASNDPGDLKMSPHQIQVLHTMKFLLKNY